MSLAKEPDLLYSFSPIINSEARVLILGSMPGVKSLAAGEYYAHPQNAFWRIMSALLAIDPKSDYAAKIEALQRAGIALWDVLHSCVREGSLDTAIEADSQTANDFVTLLQHYPNIQSVFFNGSKAEAYFKRHILPQLAQYNLHYQRLPSTSPAHASMSFAQKLAQWQVVLHPEHLI